MNLTRAGRRSTRFLALSVTVGTVSWLVGLAVARPSPFDTAWASALLLLVPLVLLPVALSLIKVTRYLQLPAALLLGVAYLLPQGPTGGCLALAWLGLTGLLAWDGLTHLRRDRQPASLALAAGLVYVAVGGGWAVLDRWGLRPLGFEAVIVLLTAIHFHHAGLLLPLLTGLAARDLPGRHARLAVGGVVLAVPLVAVGITATQLHVNPWLETAAAWFLAAAGLLVAGLYARLARRADRPFARALFGTAAASLAAGMLLAGLYGARFVLPMAWLDIPWMRALHGTLNGVGFGAAGLAGWAVRGTAPPEVTPEL